MLAGSDPEDGDYPDDAEEKAARGRP